MRFGRAMKFARSPLPVTPRPSSTSLCPAFRAATDPMAAHNISTRKRTSEVMASELQQWSDFEFRITCGSCRIEKQVYCMDLMARYGRQTVSQVTGRFRCSLPQCGGRPARVVLRRGNYEVPLIGPGAYG